LIQLHEMWDKEVQNSEGETVWKENNRMANSLLVRAASGNGGGDRVVQIPGYGTPPTGEIKTCHT